ncbi:MAG TPA: PPK2 family polyphosphate kinase [Gemmatimonadaceae bacterium]|nr:PPK2 family polyphosphate kinase [Gemmatimonadaceae bacterium]
MAKDPAKLKPVTTDRQVRLDDEDAGPPAGLPTGDELIDAAKRESKRIRKLQGKFYADARYALLVVLQGRDASGKDGTVKKVFRSVNPMGCEVTSFKEPTQIELEHDFLWRIEQRIPRRRMIGIFNRSHYEDVIVPRVHKTLPKSTWSARYDEINAFERTLTENSVVILKFFLHVSRDEQKKRLIDRLEDRKKNWKFRLGDLDDRKLWPEYTDAYRDAITKCSTKGVPWYVVPADDEDVRDLLVARKIADTLDSLDLKYPPLDPKLRGLKIE